MRRTGPRLIVVDARASRQMVTRLASRTRGWVMFGEGLSDVERWSDAMRDHLPRVDPSLAVEDLHEQKTRVLSNWIHRHAVRSGSKEEWWLFPVSDRSGWPPSVVQDLCVASWLLARIKRKREALTVVTTSLFLALTLRGACRRQGVRYETIGMGLLLSRWVVRLLRGIADTIVACMDGLAVRRKLSKTRLASSPPRSTFDVVLRTYPHARSFCDAGRFEDPYFGRLPEVLRASGHTVLVVLDLSSIRDVSSLSAWSGQAPHAYVVVEAVLRRWDYIKGFVVAIRSLLVLPKLGARAWSVYDWVRPDRSFGYYVKSLLPLALDRIGVVSSTLIFRWENFSFDKVVVNRLRGKVKTIGYLHGIPFPQSQIVNFGKPESSILPYPDRLVSCSRFVNDWLADRGVPREILMPGPSLRHEYVFEPTVSDAASGACYCVLAILPMDDLLTHEFARVIRDVAVRLPDFEFIVKPHPFISHATNADVESVLSEVVEIERNASIASLLDKADHFVYCGGTTVTCEALARGKRLYRYVSSNRISLDCLSFKLAEHRKSFSTVEGLVSGIQSGDASRPAPEPGMDRYVFGESRSDEEIRKVFLDSEGQKPLVPTGLPVVGRP